MCRANLQMTVSKAPGSYYRKFAPQVYFVMLSQLSLAGPPWAGEMSKQTHHAIQQPRIRDLTVQAGV